MTRNVSRHKANNDQLADCKIMNTYLEVNPRSSTPNKPQQSVKSIGDYIFEQKSQESMDNLTSRSDSREFSRFSKGSNHNADVVMMMASHSKRRQRTSYKKWQLEILDASFRINHYPDSATRSELVRKLKISMSNVQVWFKNRRQKQRRLQHPGVETKMAKRKEDHDQYSSHKPSIRLNTEHNYQKDIPVCLAHPLVTGQTINDNQPTSFDLGNTLARSERNQPEFTCNSNTPTGQFHLQHLCAIPGGDISSASEYTEPENIDEEISHFLACYLTEQISCNPSYYYA